MIYACDTKFRKQRHTTRESNRSHMPFRVCTVHDAFPLKEQATVWLESKSPGGFLPEQRLGNGCWSFPSLIPGREDSGQLQSHTWAPHAHCSHGATQHLLHLGFAAHRAALLTCRQPGLERQHQTSADPPGRPPGLGSTEQAKEGHAFFIPLQDPGRQQTQSQTGWD